VSEWRASFEAAIAITKTKIRAVQVMPDCYSREPGFAIDRGSAFVRSMPRERIELPPAVACAFVRDMQASFAPATTRSGKTRSPLGRCTCPGSSRGRGRSRLALPTSERCSRRRGTGSERHLIPYLIFWTIGAHCHCVRPRPHTPFGVIVWPVNWAFLTFSLFRVGNSNRQLGRDCYFN
jgi:hypothetical protein